MCPHVGETASWLPLMHFWVKLRSVSGVLKTGGGVGKGDILVSVTGVSQEHSVDPAMMPQSQT